MTNTARASVLPDIPTVAETGYPELSLDGLLGFFGTSGMSQPLRAAIAADVRAAMDPFVISVELPHSARTLCFGGSESTP